jgi:putative transposase
MTESIRIKKTDPFYQMLDNYCFMSKNLYNQGQYRIRQDYCFGKGYNNYNAVDASFKADNGYNNLDYRNMPTAVSAQQTLTE